MDLGFFSADSSNSSMRDSPRKRSLTLEIVLNHDVSRTPLPPIDHTPFHRGSPRTSSPLSSWLIGIHSHGLQRTFSFLLLPRHCYPIFVTAFGGCLLRRPRSWPRLLPGTGVYTTSILMYGSPASSGAHNPFQLECIGMPFSPLPYMPSARHASTYTKPTNPAPRISAIIVGTGPALFGHTLP